MRCRTNRELPATAFYGFGVRVCCHCCSAVVTLTACGEAVLQFAAGRNAGGQLAVHDGAQTDGNRPIRLSAAVCWAVFVGYKWFDQRADGLLVTSSASITDHATPDRLRGGNGQRQNVTITEVAGSQTFTLTGTLSSAGSTMMGTYTSTAGRRPTAHLADTP